MLVLAIIVSAIVPLTIIPVGYWLKNNAPSEINSFSGYRTKRSMASQEAWSFANRYCGELWIKGGAITIAPSVIITIIFSLTFGNNFGLGAASVIEVLQVALLFVPIHFVEKQLRLKFDDNGRPIEKE